MKNIKSLQEIILPIQEVLEKVEDNSYLKKEVKI